MDSGIIISLILGFVGVVSSVCFGFIPNKRKLKIERLEKKVLTMAQDIESFYAIEQLLLEQISSLTGKNKETLKKEVRKKVRIEKGRPLSNYAKPSGFDQEL